MKTIALVTLFFVAIEANFFEQFFDGPKNDNATFQTDYRKRFADKYRMVPGLDHGREMFENGVGTFSYGDEKLKEHICGNDPDGQQTWARQSLACMKILTGEMNNILREMAAKSVEKSKNIMDEYVRISRWILDVKISKIRDGKRRTPFKSIKFHNLDVRFFNVLEYAYNIGGTMDEELYQKYSFFEIPGSKRNMSPVELWSLVGRLSTVDSSSENSVKYNTILDGKKALEEQVQKLNELSKPFGEIQNSTMYLPTMKWQFLKYWYYYDTLFFNEAKLSTHSVRLGDKVVI